MGKYLALRIWTSAGPSEAVSRVVPAPRQVTDRRRSRAGKSTARRLRCSVTAAAAIALALLAMAVPSKGAGGEIVVGISAALSGPSAQLGRGMRLGIEACFRRVNEMGGVSGRTLRLVALDDSYQASPVKENMLRLIDREQVLAVVGSVGTAGAAEAVPLAQARKVLFFGAFSGADLLRRQP